MFNDDSNFLPIVSTTIFLCSFLIKNIFYINETCVFYSNKLKFCFREVKTVQSHDVFCFFSPQSREQRVTGICVFLLTGLSVFMAPILKVTLQLSQIFPLQLERLFVSFRTNSCHIPLKFKLICF